MTSASIVTSAGVIWRPVVVPVTRSCTPPVASAYGRVVPASPGEPSWVGPPSNAASAPPSEATGLPREPPPHDAARTSRSSAPVREGFTPSCSRYGRRLQPSPGGSGGRGGGGASGRGRGGRRGSRLLVLRRRQVRAVLGGPARGGQEACEGHQRGRRGGPGRHGSPYTLL